MSNLVHHRRATGFQDTDAFEVPPRVLLAAGVGLVLLVLAMALFNGTSVTAPQAVLEQGLPFAPFVPVL